MWKTLGLYFVIISQNFHYKREKSLLRGIKVRKILNASSKDELFTLYFQNDSGGSDCHRHQESRPQEEAEIRNIQAQHQWRDSESRSGKQNYFLLPLEKLHVINSCIGGKYILFMVTKYLRKCHKLWIKKNWIWK